MTLPSLTNPLSAEPSAATGHYPSTQSNSSPYAAGDPWDRASDAWERARDIVGAGPTTDIQRWSDERERRRAAADVALSVAPGKLPVE